MKTLRQWNILFIILVHGVQSSRPFMLRMDASSNALYKGTLPTLDEFTICLWINANSTYQGHAGAPLSYATWNSDNELLLYDIYSFKIFVKGTTIETNECIAVDRWIHVCVLWRSDTGYWALYTDGTNILDGTGLSTNLIVDSGGSISIGQEQDSVGGGFDTKQALVADIAHVGIWSTTMDPAAISNLANDCSGKLQEGDIFKWVLLDLNLSGTTEVLNSDICGRRFHSIWLY
ncbi:neuronal pentraxin-1-like [Saccoglossus kowalevskii]|uniref:Pentraxin family member n=1 Tax=Saccoglossus kowalevskii TaxID=10224 RepID=A0ABM0M763_SACKO|nr:PREDICTED: neuronal pentraxin-1-like [Saccoglossus kowalevskii]